MKRLYSFIIFVLILSSLNSFNSIAQEEEEFINYEFGLLFNDGIFLDFNSFRNNIPMDFGRMIIPSYDLPDFFRILDTVSEIVYSDDFGISQRISKKNVWGYSKNGRPYIFYNGKANLIPYVGSISHFVSTVKVIYQSFSDPFYYPYYSPFYDPYYSFNHRNRTYQSEELVHYIIDMETGTVLEYNSSNLEEIFKREPKIYEEFSKLSKRKKNKQLFYYVRLYNELRPLKFQQYK
ncbi:MAG: hypothetical protein WHW07_06520 [Bacteroidales bacterium]|jgi:hypothetical protein